MLSIANRHRLKIILERISEGEAITLKERIFVDNFADQNQTVNSCLRKARRLQQRQEPKDEIEQLLNCLDLNPADPESQYKPNIDDLGEWFTGAPSWLGRS